MFIIKSGTRMIQTRQNIKDDTYTLYNTQLDKKLIINAFAAKLLRKFHSSNQTNHDSVFNTSDKMKFKKQLIDLGFIIEIDGNVGSMDNTVFIVNRSQYSHPLTAFNIELTNICNLRCKHCYGSFSKTLNSEFIPYEWITTSLSELNTLNTQTIALTGGESTIHKKFIDIAMLFLEHGFELTIFTNGYNPKVIEKLLEMSKTYHYTIKISLDGFEEVHNTIRGREILTKM